MKKYSALFPQLNESTVRSFRKQVRRNGGTGESRKTTQPLKLGKELDALVIKKIKGVRKDGGAINTTIAIAFANGIIRKRSPHLLVENGGHISLKKCWAQSLFRRMGWCKRHATTGKLPLPTAFVAEQKLRMAHSVACHITEHDIPEELVLNWDQTNLKYIPTGQWTMEQHGAKKVAIAGMDDKRSITALVTCSAAGEMLPMQLIYGGKTPQCHPTAPLPEGTHVTQNPTHYSTEKTMLEFLENIIQPYIKRKREELGRPDVPALLIFDVFRAHSTTSVLAKIKELNCIAETIPPNMTDHLQPLDIAVNKPIKDFLKQKFAIWYAYQVERISEEPDSAKRLSELLKPVAPMRNRHAGWLNELAIHFSQPAQRQIIRNGFAASGVTDALTIALVSMDPFIGVNFE